MASTNGVSFPESVADFLPNPVNIRFGSMLAAFTAPAACLVIEGNTVTTHQQIETDLLKKTHPPTPSDLIAGIDCVRDMLSDTIKVCERVKRPRTTPSTSSMPLGLRNAARVASRYMKRKIQIDSGLYIKIVEAVDVTSTSPVLSARTPSTPHASAVSSKSFADLSPRLAATS
jgi:hypothetical protein